MSALETVAARIEAGEAPSDADARLVFDTRDLIAAGAIADDVRRRRHGSRTTFVRVLEVHAGAVPTVLPPGAEPGEIRLVGETAGLDEWLAAVALARQLAPAVAVTAFSLAVLEGIAAKANLTVTAVAARLAEAGLSAVAEVIVDDPADPSASIDAARAGGLQVLRLTVRGAADGDPLDGAVRARDLQARLGGFLAFAPLPQQVSVATPTTGYDDVKRIAASRLLAANIPSIQVDWVRYGPKLAQVALTTGADDIDGIAAGPGSLGTRRSPLAEVRKNIRAAALEPVERSGLFSPLPAVSEENGA